MEPAERRKLGWAWYVAVLAFYFVVMSVGAGSTRALTQHEVFAAEPAREMLAGARWVIQTFAGVPRYEKPPAMSWMIAGCFRVLGIGEFAARLPSIVAGGVVVALVMRVTARVYDRKTAIFAGLMQSTAFYTVIQARLSEADMPMLAVVTAGMVALGEAWVFGDAEPRPRESGGQAVRGYVFAACAGLAVLIKGPAGIATMYSAALALAALNRSWRILWWTLHPARLATTAVVGLSWYAAAYLADPHILQQWHQEANYMTGQAEDQREPPWFYVWNIPMMVLPWIVFCVPLAIGRWRDEPWKSPFGRFVLAWVVPGFLILTAAHNKHKHYCMPLLPPLTVLSAAGMAWYMRRQYSRPPKHYAVVISLWVVALAGGIAATFKFAPDHPANIAVVLGVLLVGGVAVLLAESARRERSRVAFFFGTAGLCIAAINLLVTPVFDDYGDYRALARRMAAQIPAGRTTWIMGLGQSQLAFYLDLPVRRIDHLPTTRPTNPEVEYVVCPASATSTLEQTFGAPATELIRDNPARKPKSGGELVLLRFGPAR